MNYYLQFYRNSSLLFNEINYYTELMNGYSHVKFSDGEYIWANQDLTELPVSKGNIYASVWYKQSAIRLYEIAEKNPDLNIFIGGPICFHYDLTLKRDNYHVLRKDAEDEFKNPSEWNLIIPDIETDIGYSVSLVKGVGCYWGKCIFCKQTGELANRKIDTIPIIDHPGHKYIWLHTFAMSAKMMNKYYPTFEDRNDITYSTYIRADKSTIAAYKKLKLKVAPKYLGFDIGIEFPSDHMLEYMKKGTTVQEYIDFIELTADTNLHFNLIIGWKNTTWNDVKEVESFLNSISKVTKPNSITVNLYPLIIVENRYIWNEYKNDQIQWYTDKNTKWPADDKHIWNCKMGEPVLSKEQQRIKSELRRLYHNFPWLKLHDWTSDKLY